MSARTERAKIMILKALDNSTQPMGASRIASAVNAMGVDLQPRTIRLHLSQLDNRGFTKLISRRKGRVITKQGQGELANANVADKIGIIAAKIDALGYQMSFSMVEEEGTIVMNLSVIDARDLERAVAEMRPVFKARLGMGTKLLVTREGDTVCNYTVPKGSVAIGTVCSITTNGILLHEGVPVTSRFSGLLEMRNGEPARFVQLVEYRGTTLDPMEIFAKADMTRVSNVVRTGSGIVGASFREIPSVAVDDVWRIENVLREKGLGSIMLIGRPNQPLLDIPVADGRCGMIVSAGLNPVAAVQEAGIDATMRPLAGLQEFRTLVPFLRKKLTAK